MRAHVPETSTMAIPSPQRPAQPSYDLLIVGGGVIDLGGNHVF